MKKLLFILSIILFSTSTCFAQIGYVDYSYIFKNLPISQQYKKRMDIMAEKVRAYNLETNKLIKAQTTQEAKAKIRDERKPQLYKLERDYINLSTKRDIEVQQKVKNASGTIRVQKKLDAIVDSRFMISGGINCTIDVFKAIK